MSDSLFTMIAIFALVWGAAYILGSQIRRGLEGGLFKNYNVKDGHFYMTKEATRKLLEQIKKEDGE